MRRSLTLGAALLALACSGSAVPASSEAPAATPSPSTADTAAKPAPANPPAAPVGAPVPGNPDEVRRITIADTDALRQQGRAVIVDVRDKGSYDSGHVAGAVHIPLDALVARMDELPRDKPIVTYCA